MIELLWAKRDGESTLEVMMRANALYRWLINEAIQNYLKEQQIFNETFEIGNYVKGVIFTTDMYGVFHSVIMDNPDNTATVEHLIRTAPPEYQGKFFIRDVFNPVEPELVKETAKPGNEEAMGAFDSKKYVWEQPKTGPSLADSVSEEDEQKEIEILNGIKALREKFEKVKL